MIDIPRDVLSQYNLILAKKSIPISFQHYYRQWLRYYLDFCHKYGFNHSNKESLAQFIKKLQEKRQPQIQQKQADHAISLYYELLQSGVNAGTDRNIVLDAKFHPTPETTEKILPSSTMQVEEGARVKEDSVVEQWKKTYADMSAEIKIKHYSPRTLEVYTMWLRKFHGFTRNKSPLLLSSADVKEFLKYLAVRQNVSTSTQNQAFNALLFLFRYVLKKDFGDYRDCVRAKRRPYIPVVLSRDEIEAILTQLSYPY